MADKVRITRGTEWDGGFVGEMTLLPERALTGWTLSFAAAFTIADWWNAELVSQVGNVYTFKDLGWNGAVPAAGSVSFGFRATGTGPIADPTTYVLNGVPALPDGPEPPPPPPPELPTLSVADASATEGPGRQAVFNVTLSAAATAPVTVAYATANGTAGANDFRAASGTLTFAAGETRKQIRIAITDDSLLETTETFALRLSAPTGATLARANATGTILDNDRPTVVIHDASVLEGDAGSVDMLFRVELSRPVERSVSVQFATADGTARAGSDYSARSGTLVFGAGETVKTIAVPVRGDRAIEPDETFTVRLSNPNLVSIADGTAIGTIRDDDRPAISIADAPAVAEGDPLEGPVGALSTRGNQIVDATGAPVRLAAVNWFGMETTSLAPHGLNVRNWKDMMDQMAELGFNAIRLPFSAKAVLEGGRVGGINATLNPDLVGLSPLQIMDRIVDYAGEIGLRVLLDHHRSNPGNGPNPNGLWYDGRFTEAKWIGMWEMLAQRYKGDPTVIGADLSNEPHKATWDAWAGAAERAGNAILAKNPDWLIVVEGVATHAGDAYWWGGQLEGAATRPVVLNVANRLVYSPHDYPASVHAQPWFSDPAYPNNLPAEFDEHWGYLWRENIAPVLVGEMGSKLATARDQAWLDKLVAYLGGDLDGNGTKDRPELGPSFAWWSWNPNSRDTGGILKADWQTPEAAKLAALDPLLADTGHTPSRAVFDVTLSRAATVAVTVGWRTVADTATAEDFVAGSGTLTFAPGETRKRIAITLIGDETPEADESFRVELSAPTNATIADGIGVARILNDDWAL